MRTGNGDFWDRLNSFMITEDAYQAEEERLASDAEYDAFMADASVIAAELEEEYEDFISHLRALSLTDAEPVERDAGKVMLREITAGIIAKGQIEPFDVIAEMLCRSCSIECARKDIDGAFVSKRPLFDKVGVLNDGECGTFWLRIISRLPPETDEQRGEALGGLLELAEKFYSDFAGERAEDIDLAGKFAAHRRRFAAMRAGNPTAKE